MYIEIYMYMVHIGCLSYNLYFGEIIPPSKPSSSHVCTASTCGACSPEAGRFSSSARGREAPVSSATEWF